MPRETHRGVHVLVVWLLQLVAGAASAAAHRGDAGHGLARAAPAVQSRYVGFAATGTCVCRPDHMHNKYCNFSDALGRNDPSNYDCRNYSNIAEMAQVSVVKFGDEANRTVPCALLGDNADPNHDLCTFHGGWPTSGLLRQLPGRRVLWLDFAASFAGRNGSISAHPKDLVVLGNASACPNDQNSIFTGIWWDHGAAAVAAQAELFFPALYAAGGRVDQLVLDFELSMLTPTACKPPYAGGAPGVPKTTANQLSVQACRACIEEKWRAIQNDHRFAAQDLPKLQEMGLQVDPSKKDYLVSAMMQWQCTAGQWPHAMTSCVNDQHNDTNRKVWNSYIHQRASEYWAMAMAPAFKVFPTVQLSNFGETGWSSEHCHAPDPNTGSMNCLHGRGASAFALQAPVYYDLWTTFDCFHQGPGNGPNHALGGHTDDPDYCAENPSAAVTLNQLFGVSSFNFTSWHVLQLLVAHGRDLAATGVPVAPWLTVKSWWIEYPLLVSDFYEEKILQLGTVGVDKFFLWNLWEEPMYASTLSTHDEYEIFSAMLSELDQVLGGSVGAPPRPIPDSPRYTDGFLLSGTEQPDVKRVWRLSVRTECATYSKSAPAGCQASPLLSKDEAGYLTLGPVEFDESGVGSGAVLLCELSFEGGSITNATANFGRRAQFGVWVSQPSNGSVALRCPGRPDVAWPLQ